MPWTLTCCLELPPCIVHKRYAYISFSFIIVPRNQAEVFGVIFVVTWGDPRRHKSISSSAQYVTLQKYFSHPSFGYLLFPSPPIKLKLGLQMGGRLLIAAHLNQSNYLANQQQVLGCAAPFTSLSKLCKNSRSKPFWWEKPACF
jgi:hypothetical protein